MTSAIDEIIDKEIYFHFSRSWGHGGQNVNKRETKAQLFFNIHDSKFLTSQQKERLIHLAWNQIHHDEWVLIMSCQEERFQAANKEIVTHRFRQLLNEAMIEPKQRIQTKIPRQQKEQRIETKKQQWFKKSQRQNPKFEE